MAKRKTNKQKGDGKKKSAAAPRLGKRVSAKSGESSTPATSSPEPKAQSPEPVALQGDRPDDPNAWRMVGRLQLAELLGSHPDTVSDYTRDGMPVSERGGHGKESVYDAVACLTWWRQQQGKGAKEVAQTRAFNAQADLAEQRLRMQRKDLVSRAGIVQAWQSVQRGWSVRIQAIPRRLVQLGIVSRENEAKVTSLVKEILIDIANWRGLDDAVDDTSEQAPAEEGAA